MNNLNTKSTVNETTSVKHVGPYRIYSSDLSFKGIVHYQVIKIPKRINSIPEKVQVKNHSKSSS